MGRMAHLDERLGDGDEEGRDGGIGSEVAHSDAATRIDTSCTATCPPPLGSYTCRAVETSTWHPGYVVHCYTLLVHSYTHAESWTTQYVTARIT